MFDKDKREIVDMILAFTNKNKFFKTTAKEIKKTEYANLNLADLELNEQSIIIIEAIPKNMIVKPFLRLKIDSFNCSFCNSIIKENRINCINCTQNIYCSEICKSSDKAHHEYHQKLSNLFKKKLTLREISDINISTFLQPNSKGGLTGLKNIDGASSFINSALQCLSHCEDLTKYFLSRSFFEDLNENKQGIEGKVALAYYELLKELWVGNNNVISPWDIRNIFLAFMKQV